jgi:hypothetical protein
MPAEHVASPSVLVPPPKRGNDVDEFRRAPLRGLELHIQT